MIFLSTNLVFYRKQEEATNLTTTKIVIDTKQFEDSTMGGPGVQLVETQKVIGATDAVWTTCYNNKFPLMWCNT